MIYIEGVILDEKNIKSAVEWRFYNENYMKMIGTEITYKSGGSSNHRGFTTRELMNVIEDKERGEIR